MILAVGSFFVLPNRHLCFCSTYIPLTGFDQSAPRDHVRPLITAPVVIKVSSLGTRKKSASYSRSVPPREFLYPYSWEAGWLAGCVSNL